MRFVERVAKLQCYSDSDSEEKETCSFPCSREVRRKINSIPSQTCAWRRKSALCWESSEIAWATYRLRLGRNLHGEQAATSLTVRLCFARKLTQQFLRSTLSTAFVHFNVLTSYSWLAIRNANFTTHCAIDCDCCIAYERNLSNPRFQLKSSGWKLSVLISTEHYFT